MEWTTGPRGCGFRLRVSEWRDAEAGGARYYPAASCPYWPGTGAVDGTAGRGLWMELERGRWEAIWSQEAIAHPPAHRITPTSQGNRALLKIPLSLLFNRPSHLFPHWRCSIALFQTHFHLFFFFFLSLFARASLDAASQLFSAAKWIPHWFPLMLQRHSAPRACF